jgi:hypothetical protein
MSVRILILAACIAAGPASAGCSISDIQGTWSAYSVGAQDGASYWIKCAITVESDGRIAEGSSSCSDMYNNRTKLAGGMKLKDASLCTYEGSVTLVADDEVDKISEVTLAPDHDMASGVGISPTDGFSFSLVRN